VPQRPLDLILESLASRGLGFVHRVADFPDLLRLRFPAEALAVGGLPIIALLDNVPGSVFEV